MLAACTEGLLQVVSSWVSSRANFEETPSWVGGLKKIHIFTKTKAKLCHFLNYHSVYLYLYQSWHAILYSFQMYSMVVWHLYALQNDPHNNSSNLLSRYKVRGYWLYPLCCVLHPCGKTKLFKRNFLGIFTLCKPFHWPGGQCRQNVLYTECFMLSEGWADLSVFLTSLPALKCDQLLFSLSQLWGELMVTILTLHSVTVHMVSMFFWMQILFSFLENLTCEAGIWGSNGMFLIRNMALVIRTISQIPQKKHEVEFVPFYMVIWSLLANMDATQDIASQRPSWVEAVGAERSVYLMAVDSLNSSGE